MDKKAMISHLTKSIKGMSLINKIKECWYYLTCLIWHRYNIVTCQGLPPTWTDRDEVLIHVNFQVLVDFVEGERPFDRINWDSDEGHKQAASEIRLLYFWWMYERPHRHDPLEFFPRKDIPPIGEDNPAWTKVCDDQLKAEKQWFEEDQINLKRLIDVRPYLWT